MNDTQRSHARWLLTLLIFCAVSMVGMRTATQRVGATVGNGGHLAQATPAPTRGKYNGKLVFISDRHNSALSIWTINPDGSSPTRLTDTKPRGKDLPIFTHIYDDLPVWSPDGTKIAFISNRDSAVGSTDSARSIYIMDADGSNVKRILVDGIQEKLPEIRSVAWSPDGTKFAFDAGVHVTVPEVKATINIYTVDIDGRNIVKLTNDTDVVNVEPTWSPDGKQIAYQSNRGDAYGHSRVWVMSGDGSNQRKLIDTHNNSDPMFYYDGQPAWSPDGTRILFLGNRDFNGTRNCYAVKCSELFVVNPDGTNEQQLTSDPNRLGFQFLARWSPDGTKIVFSQVLGTIDDAKRNIDRGTAVIVMNADGSNQVNISNRGKYDFNSTEYTFTDTAADWQPLLTPSTEPPPSVLGFSSASYSAYEDSGTIAVTVTRTGNLNDSASCFYLTEDGTATTKRNYAPALGTLHFAPGEASRIISIPLTDNGYAQGRVFFTIKLSDNEGNATFLGGIREATVSVLDRDDGKGSRATNPIDEARTFVRQQYIDFLSREPDQAGWDYWTGQITKCGTDAQCISTRRTEVSAAFFIEAEFQQTGFFIFRFKLLNPNYSAFNFLAFIRDVRTIEEGASGQADAPQRLEANKTAFIQQYFDEDRITVSFGFTDEGYVDLLFKYAEWNAGVRLPQAKRDALVAGLKAGTETRPTVFRKVIEDEQYKRETYNAAFVLMQYYGYLRRDPDGRGYQFWLDVLNNRLPNDPSGYRAMVCAFLTSAEYQDRFGAVRTRSNADCAP